MSEKLLPLGTIVFLKEGIQKIVVIGRGPIIDEGEGPKLYDYAACIYPIGINKEKVFFFNKEDVSTVIFEGYSDEEEEQFNKIYTDWVATNPAPKGKNATE